MCDCQNEVERPLVQCAHRRHLLPQLPQCTPMCSVYSPQCTLLCAQCTLLSVLSYVLSVLSSVYSPMCSVYSPQCTLLCGQCTLLSVLSYVLSVLSSVYSPMSLHTLCFLLDVCKQILWKTLPVIMCLDYAKTSRLAFINSISSRKMSLTPRFTSVTVTVFLCL